MNSKSVLLNIAISLMVFSVGILVYDKYVLDLKPKTYYMVDAEKLLGDPRKKITELVSRGASYEEHKAFREQYKKRVERMDSYLNDLSKKYNIVIFNKKAIYGSENLHLVDLTQDAIDAVEK